MARAFVCRRLAETTSERRAHGDGPRPTAISDRLTRPETGGRERRERERIKTLPVQIALPPRTRNPARVLTVN